MSEPTERKELRLDHRHLTLFFLGAVGVCAVFFILGFLVGRGQSYEMAKKAMSHQELGEIPGQTKNAPAITPLGQSSTEGSLPPQSAAPPLPAPPLTEGINPPEKIEKGNANPSNKESAGQAAKKDLDFYKGVKESPSKESFPREVKQAEKTIPSAKSKPSSEKGSGKSEPVKSKTTQASKTSLSLQVAALRNLEDADQLMKKLRSIGYEVFLVRPSSNSADQLIRVQVGPFSSESETAKVKSKLQKDGYPAITKR
jgi:cell division septation protein DedD